MIKSFKLRLYPTAEQEALMWKHVGSCRFIWNYMLDLQQKRYEQGEKHLSAFDMINLLKPLKREAGFEWLSECSAQSLMEICRDLDKAYSRFFANVSGFPKFKSRKRSKPSFPIREQRFYFKDDHLLNIEKIGKVRYKTDQTFPIGKGVAKFANARVSNKNGKWMLTFGMECESQAPVLTDTPMGIDLGVKDLAVVAFGEECMVFGNINKSARMRAITKKITHTQRTISRKYEQNRVGKRYIKTNNILRAEAKLRKLHARKANIRQNYLHQITHKLVSMLPCRVTMENLNVSGMMKNRHLSKAIAEQGFYEFIRQMQYKCEWNGIEFVQADRFYPSSKTCSCCGSIKQNLKLRDRTYVCEACGAVIDRDYNAAVNLMRYAA